jgi:hypothetical protein
MSVEWPALVLASWRFPVDSVRAAASIRAIGTGCDHRVGKVGLET